MNISLHKKVLFLTGILLFSISGWGYSQGIGHWRNYLSYYNTTSVIETPNKVFAVASGALYSYTPDGNEIKKYSKIDGLNDTDISFICYSESENALLIVYSNANMDIFTNSGIYNLPYFKDNTNYTDKTINNVEIYGKIAYISTSFGVLTIDLQKKEMPEPYQLREKTYSICIQNNFIYAATSQGIYYAPTSKDLSYIDNWETYNPAIDGLDVKQINKILSFQNTLIFAQYNNGIFYKTESGRLLSGSLKNVSICNNQLIGISDNSVHFWTDLNSHTTLNDLNISDISGRKQNIFWIAQGTNGLAAIQKASNSNQYSSYHSNITINSPKNNYSFWVTFQQNKILVTGGNRWENRFNIPGTLMVLENGEWYNFDEKKIETIVKQKYPNLANSPGGYSCLDFLYVTVDPKDPKHYFVSSYGEGLYEFRDNELTTLYNFENSTLASSSSGNPYHGVRLGSTVYDSQHNLYVVNSCEEHGSSLKMYSSDQQWYDTGFLENKFFYFGDKILITNKNQIWMNFPRKAVKSDAGIFIADESGNNFYDSFTDQKGEEFIPTGYFCATEDQKGTIWVGTDRGPILFYNPQNALKNPNNFYCTRPILPFNDGSDEGFYLLETERINCITVDGANRKWLGTQNSGAYLVSETGMEILAHFTAENSPLISNTINSIAIDSRSGEIFFATEKGLTSYLGDASEGKTTYSEVRAYPNPVRPEYDNVVTITNLIQDSNVKITDMRGNLIYQGQSKGGMFTWNCVNKNGERVQTGIYLVFAATEDGSEGVVTKIMVVK